MGRFGHCTWYGARCAIDGAYGRSLGLCERAGATRMAQGRAPRRVFKGDVGAVSWRAALVRRFRATRRRCVIGVVRGWSLDQCELAGAAQMAQGRAPRRGFQG